MVSILKELTEIYKYKLQNNVVKSNDRNIPKNLWKQREGEQKRVPRKGNTCDESSRVSRTLPGEMHAGKGILDSSRNYKNTHPTVEA